ncbi:hypothetical protein R6Q59_011990 [Mikania micrantha]
MVVYHINFMISLTFQQQVEAIGKLKEAYKRMDAIFEGFRTESMNMLMELQVQLEKLKCNSEPEKAGTYLEMMEFEEALGEIGGEKSEKSIVSRRRGETSTMISLTTKPKVNIRGFWCWENTRSLGALVGWYSNIYATTPFGEGKDCFALTRSLGALVGWYSNIYATTPFGEAWMVLVFIINAAIHNFRKLKDFTHNKAKSEHQRILVLGKDRFAFTRWLGALVGWYSNIYTTTPFGEVFIRMEMILNSIIWIFSLIFEGLMVMVELHPSSPALIVPRYDNKGIGEINIQSLKFNLKSFWYKQSMHQMTPVLSSFIFSIEHSDIYFPSPQNILTILSYHSPEQEQAIEFAKPVLQDFKKKGRRVEDDARAVDFDYVAGTIAYTLIQVSCLPPCVPECEKKVEFSMSSNLVIFPPESFLSLRLQFVFGVNLEDESVYPIKRFESQPELTTWITKGMTLQQFAYFAIQFCMVPDTQSSTAWRKNRGITRSRTRREEEHVDFFGEYHNPHRNYRQVTQPYTALSFFPYPSSTPFRPRFRDIFTGLNNQ